MFLMRILLANLSLRTAPCVAISAELLYKKDSDAILVVLPADHHITEPNQFLLHLHSAIQKADSGEYLVTIGIKPDKPETGFGYIHANGSIKEEFNGKLVHPVRAFTEKPNLATAERFVASGEYFGAVACSFGKHLRYLKYKPIYSNV